MLPGFRFLFAAVVLSISTLVFGLGAAALLRASHERFASLPVSPPAPALPPAAAIADASPHDAAPPTLALLRLDAPQPDEAAAGKTPVPEGDTITATTASEPPVAAASPAPETPPEAAPEVTEATPEVTEAIAAQPEPPDTTPGEEPTASPADLSQTVAIQTEPVRTEAIEAQPAQAEPAEAAPATVTAEPHLAPQEPTDAPVRTAVLAPAEPAPSAIPEPSDDVITGPIPLPRSRQWALAQDHAAQRTAKARRLAAARARQAVRSQQQPAAPTPAFPFQ